MTLIASYPLTLLGSVGYPPDAKMTTYDTY